MRFKDLCRERQKVMDLYNLYRGRVNPFKAENLFSADMGCYKLLNVATEDYREYRSDGIEWPDYLYRLMDLTDEEEEMEPIEFHRAVWDIVGECLHPSTLKSLKPIRDLYVRYGGGKEDSFGTMAVCLDAAMPGIIKDIAASLCKQGVVESTEDAMNLIHNDFKGYWHIMYWN